MIKICIIIGTNSKPSLCLSAVEGIVEKMGNKYKMSKEFFVISESSVMACIGCKSCFKINKCPLDQSDLMNKIKYTMKYSDIIVWSSPVYSNNISGIMKNFIDRIRVYAYTMELKNKKGIIISTTGFSGGEKVNKYLTRAMFKCGINIVGSYTIFDNELMSKDIFLSKADKVVYDILLNMNEDKLKENRVRYEKSLIDKFKKPNDYLIKNFEGIIKHWENIEF